VIDRGVRDGTRWWTPSCAFEASRACAARCRSGATGQMGPTCSRVLPRDLVEYSHEFGTWWEGLTEAEREGVAHAVGLLQAKGPTLGYLRGSISSSRPSQ
jgi:hypothetical protein